MKTEIVQNNQSIWDLACQHLGHPDGAKNLIVLNPDVLNFNTNPVPGTKILVDETEIIDAAVVQYFKDKSLTSASSYTPGNWILAKGFWNDGGKWDDAANWID